MPWLALELSRRLSLLPVKNPTPPCVINPKKDNLIGVHIYDLFHLNNYWGCDHKQPKGKYFMYSRKEQRHPFGIYLMTIFFWFMVQNKRIYFGLNRSRYRWYPLIRNSLVLDQVAFTEQGKKYGLQNKQFHVKQWYIIDSAAESDVLVKIPI